jgi:predicted lipid carrier protein YhbT
MAIPGRPAPLTPALLAGLAARPLPPAALQPLLTLAMAALMRRHGEAFARLGGLGDCVFLVDPVDLPLEFLLRPATDPPSLTAVRGGASGIAPTATIRGPLLSLIDLLEGRVDGDALFFSRDLAVAGDTEAILTLRNALDGAGIDLAETAASMLGPFGGIVRRLMGPAEALIRRMTRDLEALQETLLSPLARRCDVQAAELEELRAKLDDLQRRSRRGGAGARTNDRAGALAR